MNKYLILIISLFLISCNKKQGKLELEILNNEILSCKVSENDESNKNPNDYDSKSLNIIRYKLTNNTDTTYYFNKNLPRILQSPKLLNGKVSEQESTFFIDENGTTAKIPFVCHYPTDSTFIYTKILQNKEEKSAKILGYGNNSWDLPHKNNFIIHPGETLYFEYFIHLPIDHSDTDLSYFVFDEGKKYKMKIQVFSDSTNYKKVIRKSDISTIKENNYAIFHGIITSKNEIPVKFIDCK